MKKTKIVLTALLVTVIAAVLAFGMISAAEGTEVSIDYINISHNLGRIRLYYAVSAEKLPEGAALGVDVRVGSPDSAEVRVAENQGVTVINGKEYTVFGLTVYADELTVNFYAAPYVLQGEDRTDFALAKDSIIEYATKKKAEIGDECDQIYRLIDALLEYGSCAQDYFGTNTDRPASADYHKVTLVNGKFADGFDHGYFFAGETLTASFDVKPGYAFEKWVDSTGATVSESATLDLAAGDTDATYTALLVKTGDNIAYVLDGGTLPEGKWTQYPEDEDFVLPTPTKAGYVFSGWFTSPDFDMGGNLTRIPAGSDEYFTLYAKWNKTVVTADGATVRNKISTLCFVYDNAETYGGNGNELAVTDGVLTWTQGTVKTSQITFSGNLQSAIGAGKVFTFEFTLAKKADTPCFNSNVRLRRAGKNETIEIFNVNTSGEVCLSGGGKIAQLTEDFTTIRIAVDFNSGMRTAYDEDGMALASTKFGIPASVTSLAEWYDLLTSSYWQWLASGGAPTETSAIRIKSFTLNVGNSAERGTGIPVTLVDKAGEKNYNLVYDSDSAEAKAAADSLAALLSDKGLRAPAVIADTTVASTNEIVFGAADREEAADVAADLLAESKKEPDNHWWAAAYKGGKLYVLATDKYGYASALKYINDRMFRDGELVVGSETAMIFSRTHDDALLDSIVDMTPHEAYMEYEVPGNFYDGYTDPFGMKDTDYKKMVVTRSADATITIDYYPTDATYYRVNFVRKAWGMWMLGAITYVDHSGTHSICPGSTDYEFVFNVGAKTTPSTRSGNHGNYPGDGSWAYHEDDSSYYNDRLLDMTLYDARSGDKITLDTIGESATVDGLRIVMHHNVYELNYKQDNVLMNAEKSYLFNGFDILLDASLYMTQDVKFRNSYSCMLPIMKDHSNCIMLYNADGTTTYAKTSPVATGGRDYDYTVWHFNSPRVELWGENNPEYHMTVEVMNPEIQFMGGASSQSYVGIRDMLGGAQNKIYFTFAATRPTLPHGAELHFENKWSFSYHEGFENPDREPDVTVIKELQ